MKRKEIVDESQDREKKLKPEAEASIENGLHLGYGSLHLIKQGAEGRLYQGLYHNQMAIFKERFKKTYRVEELDKKLSEQRLTMENKLMSKARLKVDTPKVLSIEKTKRVLVLEYINGLTVRDVLMKFDLGTSNVQDQKVISIVASLIGSTVFKLHHENIIHGDLTTSNMMIRQQVLQPLLKLCSSSVSLSSTSTSTSLSTSDAMLSSSFLSSASSSSSSSSSSFSASGSLSSSFHSSASSSSASSSSSSNSCASSSASSSSSFFSCSSCSDSASSSTDASRFSLVMLDFGLSYTSHLIEDKAVDLYVLERAFLSTHPNSQNMFNQILQAYASSSDQKAQQVIAKLDAVRLRGRKRTMVG
eukprot:TRINITY_DN784_c0_g2_i1.p1 TRINITY_DN784_c0_g2~~TRINITY_DN784_c0_g2_i1.p1  ORF type:complete len:360 (-),score=128.00 TRINITY_DN784_c0_g2_i1:1306-2385(-)